MIYLNHIIIYLHIFNAFALHNPRDRGDDRPINVTASVETIVGGLSNESGARL